MSGPNEMMNALREALVQAQVGHWRRDNEFRCACGADTITGFLGHLADALLPVVTAYAEQRARERAAEELFVLASRLVADDVKDMRIYDHIGVLRDALAADDRTGQQ